MGIYRETVCWFGPVSCTSLILCFSFSEDVPVDKASKAPQLSGPNYFFHNNNGNCCTMTFGGDYGGLYVFYLICSALAYKNPSYVECTRYSCNILLIYVQVI